jgi:hypothetical protein
MLIFQLYMIVALTLRAATTCALYIVLILLILAGLPFLCQLILW